MVSNGTYIQHLFASKAIPKENVDEVLPFMSIFWKEDLRPTTCVSSLSQNEGQGYEP